MSPIWLRTWRAVPEVRRGELPQQIHEVGLALAEQRPQQLDLVDLAPAPHALHVAQDVAFHQVILSAGARCALRSQLLVIWRQIYGLAWAMMFYDAIWLTNAHKTSCRLVANDGRHVSLQAYSSNLLGTNKQQ